ncbi:MAG TPA: hypothetical protein V6C82_02480 [Chroococcales cyanobacterium]|jgi:hypothetical protein
MEIVFVDGNDGSVVSRVPFEEVPPQNREVPQPDGSVVAIAKVVKLSVDEKGNPVPGEKAAYVLISEYDADSRLLRETRMVRK